MIKNKQACFCPLGVPLILLSDPPSLRALCSLWLEKSVAIRVFSAAEPVSKRKRSLMTYCQNNCVRGRLRLSSFFLTSDLWILEAAYSTANAGCKVWQLLDQVNVIDLSPEPCGLSSPPRAQRKIY